MSRDADTYGMFFDAQLNSDNEYDRLKKYISDETETETVNADETGNPYSPQYPDHIEADAPVWNAEGLAADYDKLYEINNDLVCILSIPSLDLKYPVVQGSDNVKYLNTTFEGNKNPAGCLFIDYENSRDMTDPHTYIYGHNMKDGAMFATVHDFEDEDFFNDHPYVYVYTPDQELVYAAYAAYYYSDILIPYYFNYFESPSDLDYYLAEISLYGNKDDGHIRSGISPDNTSHIITLSTCNSTGSARYLLQCVLIDYLGDGAISDDDLADCSDEIRSGWRDAEPEWAVIE